MAVFSKPARQPASREYRRGCFRNMCHFIRMAITRCIPCCNRHTTRPASSTETSLVTLSTALTNPFDSPKLSPPGSFTEESEADKPPQLLPKSRSASFRRPAKSGTTGNPLLQPKPQPSALKRCTTFSASSGNGFVLPPNRYLSNQALAYSLSTRDRQTDTACSLTSRALSDTLFSPPPDTTLDEKSPWAASIESQLLRLKIPVDRYRTDFDDIEFIRRERHCGAGVWWTVKWASYDRPDNRPFGAFKFCSSNATEDLFVKMCRLADRCSLQLGVLKLLAISYNSANELVLVFEESAVRTLEDNCCRLLPNLHDFTSVKLWDNAISLANTLRTMQRRGLKLPGWSLSKHIIFTADGSVKFTFMDLGQSLAW